jgi:hypothetical protein
MRKADIAFGIDDTIQGHSPQFEQIHFLPVRPGNGMIRIGQTDERHPFIPPILLKNGRPLGSDRQDLYPTARKETISITQARQLRAAVRSHETAQEGKHHRLAAKFR